jgi:hypothetical protein
VSVANLHILTRAPRQLVLSLHLRSQADRGAEGPHSWQHHQYGMHWEATWGR